MRPPLTLPKAYALKVLTGYAIPLDSVRVVLENPGTIHIKGGRDTLNVLDAPNGKVTIR